MKQKHIDLYKDLMIRISQMSYDPRTKVGALIVKDNNILSFGWNGTPSGFDNNTKDENGETKPEVVHAEANCIAKAARQGISINGSSLFVLYTPCYDCAKLIIQSGIKELYYVNRYWRVDSIPMLEKAGIKCIELSEKGINDKSN